MSQFFQIHPENPQVRLIRQAVSILDSGGVICYPTDSAYAWGCRIGDKKAVNRIRKIRHLNEKHNLTLVCRDLSELATYAKVGNTTYRLLKAADSGCLYLYSECDNPGSSPGDASQASNHRYSGAR